MYISYIVTYTFIMQQYNITKMVKSYWIYRVRIKLSHNYNMVRLKFKPRYIKKKQTPHLLFES